MTSSVRAGRAALPDSVVITGLGLIHGLGMGLEPLLAAASPPASLPRKGSSGEGGTAVGSERRDGEERSPASRISPPASEPIECSHFEPEELRESGKTYLDRCSELTLGACYLAVRDAGLSWQEGEHPRWGVSLGTAYGCLGSMLNMTGRVQQKGMRFGSPVIFTHSFANSPGALAAIEYDLQGPCMTHCVGGLSGAAALEYALSALRLGRADLLLAGGVEAMSQPLLAGIDRDNLDGIPAEGAVIFAVETAEHAAGRSASPLAELAGAAVLAGSQGDGALGRALTDAQADSAEIARAPAGCGHAFGAAVALDAAMCVGLLTQGHQGPLAAVSRDGRAAVVFKRWNEQ